MIISTIQKLCLFLLSYCRLSITHNLANILAILLFSKKSKKYLVAEKNLSICFTGKSKEWVESTAKKSLKEYLKSLLESPYLYRVSKKNMNTLINKVHNENIIEKYSGENKGIIFMTPHHGSWELSGLYVASKIKTYNMFTQLRNNILNNFVFKGRKVPGATLVDTDNNGVKKFIRALRHHCGLVILPDPTPNINHGVMSSFYCVPVID